MQPPASMTGRNVWTLNHQNLSIERYRVHGADHPASKCQLPRVGTPQGRDFARDRGNGPPVGRRAAVFSSFSATLSLANDNGVRGAWERTMRAGIVACMGLGLALTLSACSDAVLIREGIGTNLAAADL